MDETSYFLPDSTLSEKEKSLIDRVIEYISDPTQRETGLSFILNSLDTPRFCSILLQVHPRLYAQFLDSEDPVSLTNSLYIVNALSKRPEFVAVFVKHDPHILASVNKLLGSQVTTIVEQAVGILYAFVSVVRNFDVLNVFIQPLINAMTTDPVYRPAIMVLLTKLIASPKNQQTFIDGNGLAAVKHSLEAGSGEELIAAVEIVYILLKTDLKRNRELMMPLGILRNLTEVIRTTDNQAILERTINAASQFAGSEFFATTCIESGLFEECLDTMDYPYTGRTTPMTIQPALLMVFRVTQDRIGVQKCSSLKLTSRLRNLIGHLEAFTEPMQAIILGITTNLLANEQARREMFMTQVDKAIQGMRKESLHPKAALLLEVCADEFAKKRADVSDVEYTPADIALLAEYNSRKTKARQITEELIQTETSYSRNMGTCVRVVMKRLEGALKGDFGTVFLNIADIERFHHRLSYELEQAQQRSEEAKQEFIAVAGVLLRFFTPAMLEMYTRYANEIDTGMARFAELAKTDKDVEQVAKELSASGYSVSSLLIQPIQRIPRYVLLLESLVKCLPAYLDEARQVSAALEKIHGIARDINENKRKFENASAMRLWDGRLNLATEYPNETRDYVGEMSQVLVSENKNAFVWTMVIFTDIAVLARNTGTEKKEKWKVKEVYTLIQWKVLEIADEKLQFLQLATNKTVELSCSKVKDTEYLADKLREAIRVAKANRMRKSLAANN